MSALDDLPPLRDVIAAHDLAARKQLGQHFLLDLNLTRRIARSGGDLKGLHVIEIGPGPGGLTRALLESDAASITALEKDKRCVEALQPLIAHSEGRLRVIEADALECDFTSLTPSPRAVIANLPYNISTPILLKLLREAKHFDFFLLMFQKEVAERIVAEPGNKIYGRLSVVSQFACECKRIFNIPAKAFTPPPKIDSSVVHMVTKKESAPVSIKALEAVTEQAFGQRRKMLRGIFKGQLDEAAFVKLGIKGEMRPEQLSIKDFISLTKLLA